MAPLPPEVVTPLTDFARLYREHAADVHRFAVYLSGDLPLADDLVSEAFVRVWTARERVELTTVRGYLFAIVRNLFLQHLRHERRRAPLDESIAGRSARTRKSVPPTRAALQAVLSALHALPEVDRAAVLMRANGELTYRGDRRGAADLGGRGQGEGAPRAARGWRRRWEREARGPEPWGEGMKITRDVVKDLLAVYSAGEASGDTRALVEEWLRSDPELARQVARADSVSCLSVPAAGPYGREAGARSDAPPPALADGAVWPGGLRVHSAVQHHLRQTGATRGCSSRTGPSGSS